MVRSRPAGRLACSSIGEAAPSDSVRITAGPQRAVLIVTRRIEMAESYSGEAYCVKCKAKREFDGHVEEKNGRRMAKGKCPVCDTTVVRILGKAS